MWLFATPAILLRRQEYGDHDIIVTFLTPQQGKISVIAKNAKKSRKRFGGILEPFTGLDIVCSRGRGFPILREAALEEPFDAIRTRIKKTAYAGYWAELVIRWLEEWQPQTRLYDLLHHVLSALHDCSSSDMTIEFLSLLFQMRFAVLSGYRPDFSGCALCHAGIDKIYGNLVAFDLSKGALVCEKCRSKCAKKTLQYLTKGTIKQLVWLTQQDFEKALRVRFSPYALSEGLRFLNAFVPYHLGIEPGSLQFIKKVF
jgi:DNA repair protein RecO (recombination protein O)